MESIGHRGMQLFIDAGMPVNNTLVDKLVNEVLQEKIRGMLGQRPDQEAGPSKARPISQDNPVWEEPLSEEIEQVGSHYYTVSNYKHSYQNTDNLQLFDCFFKSTKL